MQRPLFLTGMMGCGKTTVGRALADTLGVPMVDLDARIERVFGLSVPALLARGEPEFREHERRALASLLAEPGLAGRGVVVATGGGAILDPCSRETMDAIGVRVYLEVGAEELMRRLAVDEAADEGARPLLEGRARLRQRVTELLAARRALYRSAARCVDGQGAPGEVVARVMEALGEGERARGSEAV